MALVSQLHLRLSVKLRRGAIVQTYECRGSGIFQQTVGIGNRKSVPDYSCNTTAVL